MSPQLALGTTRTLLFNAFMQDRELFTDLCSDFGIPAQELHDQDSDRKRANLFLNAVYQLNQLEALLDILKTENPDADCPTLEQLGQANWAAQCANHPLPPNIASHITQIIGDNNTVVAQQGVNVGGGIGGNAEINTGTIHKNQIYIVSDDQGGHFEQLKSILNIPPNDPAQLLNAYLTWLIEKNRVLPLQGIQSKKHNQQVYIELEEIYVTLRTVTETMLDRRTALLDAEREMVVGAKGRVEHIDRIKGVETITVNRALKENQKLAIIGDPGSGKTTLLRYLALIYAKDFDSEPGLVAQTFSDSEITFDERQKLPIFLELRQLGAYIRQEPSYLDGPAQLLDLYRLHFKNQGIDLPKTFFDGYLNSGQAIVLLDGLDEVADGELKQRVSRLIETFTTSYPSCRFVVSSRVAGYRRLGAGYHEATIREFRLDDVRQFLHNWYRKISIDALGTGPQAEAYTQRRTDDLANAIAQNQTIRDLAVNPLMLTVIALIHKDLESTSLPSQRAALYEQAVDVLINTWDAAKIGLTHLQEGEQISATQRRLILQAVALHMQEQRTRELGENLLQELLRRELSPLYPDQADVASIEQRFMQLLEERTGILVAKDEGVYGFSHLTFQEYLAGCAIANKDGYIPYTLERTGDSWWRETILLEAGYLGLKGWEKVSHLVQAIADHPDEPSQYHNTVLALACINDVGDGKVEATVQEHVQAKLQAAINVPLKGKKDEALREAVNVRGLAVSALQQAGMGYWYGPHGEPEWITIPAGEFEMGAGVDDDDKLIHNLPLPEFKISRVPITNGQYFLFTTDTGYEAPKHWEGDTPKDEIRNHPVVQLTWHDCLKYCDWLSQKTGQAIILPSEAEWEKAAGWDAVKQQKRAFPWGDEFDLAKLNCDSLGLNSTSPVGIFHEGASPYGVLDMAGNVWEWTRSHWKEYEYDPDDGLEDLTAGVDVGRVLRGGSFVNFNQDLFRVAYRSRDVPYDRIVNIGFRVVLLSSPISS